MEISGKVLREVEFRDRLRGYDTDEVDEFLEHVAVAIDELAGELASVRQRAERAERQLQEAPELDDDGIRKTLVLAQRTADMALREARAEAEQLVTDARARADAVLSDAEDAASRLRDETDREVRQRSSHLTEQHDRLTREIRILGALLESERARITQSLTEALRFVAESMGVSEDVSSAIGPRADQAGDAAPATGEGARSESAGPRADAQGARPPGRAPSPLPLPPTPEAPPRAPGGRGEETAAPGGSGDASVSGRHFGQDAGVPTGAAGRPGADVPGVPSGSASREPRPREGGSGDRPGYGAATGQPGGRPGDDPSPTAATSRGPQAAAPAGGAPVEGVADLEARRQRNGADAEPPTARRRRPAGERDIEAELSEDARLASGTSGASGTAGAAGRSSDEDVLWSRWAQGSGAQLDPLEPPPTQAYRLEPDGGWTA